MADLKDQLLHELTRRLRFIQSELFSWSMESNFGLSASDREKIKKLRDEQEEIQAELKRREREP